MIQPIRNLDTDPKAAAREWLVRLQDDDLTEAEIVAWEAWIGSDPTHQQAYDQIAELWSKVGEAALTRPSARELATDNYSGALSVKAWRRRPGRLRLVWAATLAAAICVVSAGGWAIWERTGIEPVQTLRTALGQDQTSILTDGSRVRMAAQTSLDVRYRRGQRLIDLTKGEALFEVAHDRARPFVVDALRAKITAVGTAFDVHVLSGQVVVDVTEGVVDIQPADPAAGSVRVPAGRRFLTDGKRIEVAALDGGLAGQPAWLSGRLEFRAQPLSTVLEDVNRYARTSIVLGDAEAGQLDFTGTVQLDAIEAWALALPRVFPLGVRREPGRIVLTTRKSPSQND